MEIKIQQQAQRRWERMQLIQKWTDEQHSLTDMAEDEIVYSDPRKKHAKFPNDERILSENSDTENESDGSLSNESDETHKSTESEADESEDDESEEDESEEDESEEELPKHVHQQVQRTVIENLKLPKLPSYVPTPKGTIQSPVVPIDVPCVEQKTPQSQLPFQMQNVPTPQQPPTPLPKQLPPQPSSEVPIRRSDSDALPMQYR
jgi:hypothetical protein